MMTFLPEHKSNCPALAGLPCTCGAWNAVPPLTAEEIKLMNIQSAPTLRDQFAMAALQGLLSHRGNSFPVEHYDCVDFSNVSYELADAMLKARDKQDE